MAMCLSVQNRISITGVEFFDNGNNSSGFFEAIFTILLTIIKNKVIYFVCLRVDTMVNLTKTTQL